MLPPLIELRRSRWLLGWLAGIHGLSVVIAAVAAIPLLFKLPLLLAVAASFFFYLRRDYLQKGACAIRQLRIQGRNEWQLVHASGAIQHGRLDAFKVLRYLVILHFRLDSGKRCTVLVPEDAVTPDEHRRLRAGLKMGQTRAQASHRRSG